MNEEDHERDRATQVGGLFKEVGHEVGEGVARLMELMGGVRIWALRSMKKVNKRSERVDSRPRTAQVLRTEKHSPSAPPEREREREREIIRYLELDIYSEPKNIVRFLPPSLHLGSAVALGVILVHCVSFE